MVTLSNYQTRRCGFSIIDLLVSLGIFSLLLALLLPAISQAIEASRRISCANNLKQLAIGFHGYHEAFGTLPAGHHPNERFATGILLPEGFEGHTISVFAQILPFIDQNPLFESINFSSTCWGDLPVNLMEPSLRTAASTRMALFLCPSDPGNDHDLAPVNYRACIGVGPMPFRSVLFPDSGNGMFAQSNLDSWYPIPFRFATDGLSKTALLSERVVGSFSASGFDRFRDVLPQPGFEVLGVGNADNQLTACRGLNAIPDYGKFVSSGRFWFYSGATQTWYTHTSGPNSTLTDCVMVHASPTVGPSSARSLHPGVVNVVMGDGAIRSIGHDIDIRIWRALGSKNGGESFD